MASLFLQHLKSQLYKEWLLFKSSGKRIFFEVFFSVIIIILFYGSLSEFEGSETVGGSMLRNYGHEASSENKTAFSELFNPSRSYGNCHEKGMLVGLVVNDKDFLDRLKAVLRINNLKFKEFKTAAELKDHAAKPYNAYERMCIGLEVNVPTTNISQKYSYTIYGDDVNFTQSIDSPYDPSAWFAELGTFTNIRVAATFQGFLDSLIAKRATGNEKSFVAYAYAPMAVKSYTKKIMPDELVVPLISFLGLAAALVSLQFLVARMQKEKVSLMRDFMRSMGMTDSPYYLAYLIFHMFIILPASIIVTFGGILYGLDKTSGGILWFNNYLLLLSVFSLAVIINSIFKHLGAAKAGSILFYATMYYFALPVAQNVRSAVPKFFFSLVSPIAYYYCTLNIYTINERGGFTRGNLSTEFQGYTVSEGWTLMFVDTILYLLIGLYLDNVVPGMGGTKRSWNYFFTSAYWRPRKVQRPIENPEEEVKVPPEEKKLKADMDADAGARVFEPVDPGLRAQEASGECLDIKKVTKVYEDGNVAVNKVSLTVYKGQVFVLLGHNGAGKTTMLSMLTGMLIPTEGQAIIQGADIFEEVDKLRGMLGVCPQESIYYEELTVEQHLELFCAFKGVDYETLRPSLQALVSQVDFSDCLNNPAGKLSGGEMRKLSVVLSLVADPQILVLDEPTSGLDVSARQKVWELIRSKKGNAIVLMTTHYMDEAEELGDRIAIMSNGKVKCCGSSLFLKSRYETGYELSLTKAAEGANEPEITGVVQKHIPEAQLHSQSSSGLVYKLPAAATKQFPALLSELDAQTAQLGVSSYGVTINSLEDVFLKTGAEVKKERQKIREARRKREDAKVSREYSLAVNHAHSKKENIVAEARTIWLEVVRSPRILVLEIVLPFLLFLLIFVNTHDGMFHYSYTYSPDILPFGQEFGINEVTGQEKASTVPFHDLARGYSRTLFSVSYNSDIWKRLEDFDDQIYRHNKKLLGSYYIESFKNASQLQALILGNASHPYMSSLFANMLTNKYLQLARPNTDIEVKMTITPINMFRGDEHEGIMHLVTIFAFAFYAGIAFALPVGSILYSIVKERRERLRFLKFIHGMTDLEYWTGRFCGDLTKIFVPGLAVVVLSQIAVPELPFYSLILLVGLMSLLPFNYLFSYLFSDEGYALGLGMILQVIFGGAIALIMTVIKIAYIVDSPEGETGTAYVVIDLIFRFMPVYNMVATFSTAIWVMLINDYGVILYEPMDFDYLGEWLLMVIVSVVVCSCLVVIIDRAKHRSQRSNIQQLGPRISSGAELKDDDVKTEERRVTELAPVQTAVLVKKARKNYGISTRAVDDVSFAVNYGEIFALLGINGAGKTTTFKLLTSEEKPTCGEFYIQGGNVYSPEYLSLYRVCGMLCQMGEFYLGYCPQDNLLFEFMTVKEHLQFFATIKGVPQNILDEVVEHVLILTNLAQEENKLAWRLSGGNKRKLCFAIALIGYPAVMLLDEPTTGLDPKNRRDIWQAIEKAASHQAQNCGVMLSSHSMEEVEALATKIGIMTFGNLRCYGPSQHLKNKYGNAYYMEAKIFPPSPANVQAAIERLGNPQIRINTAQLAYNFLHKSGYREAALLVADNSLRAVHFTAKLWRGEEVSLNVLVEFGIKEQAAVSLQTLLKEAFGGVEVVEHSLNKLKLRIPRSAAGRHNTFAQLFAFAEKLKDEHVLSDYSLSATRLGDIFQCFANVGAPQPQRVPRPVSGAQNKVSEAQLTAFSLFRLIARSAIEIEGAAIGEQHTKLRVCSPGQISVG